MAEKLETLMDILVMAAKNNVSDVVIAPNKNPRLRVNGEVKVLRTLMVSQELLVSEKFVQGLIPAKVIKNLKSGAGSADFAKDIISGDKRFRFRLNVAKVEANALGESISDGEGEDAKENCLAIFARVIDMTDKTFSDLHLPEGVFNRIADLKKGLVLITGQTGSGKSTTISAIVDCMNHKHKYNIITLEDPIEKVYTSDKSLIIQRQLGRDFTSFGRGITDTLRQDPDVIVVGEIKDKETALAALSTAETGHLVLATLHTSGAPQSTLRLMDLVGIENQRLVQDQMATCLRCVISQQLIPTAEGVKINGKGRVASLEILWNNQAVNAIIRGEKGISLSELRNSMANGADGMITRESYLDNLKASGVISSESQVNFRE